MELINEMKDKVKVNHSVIKKGKKKERSEERYKK